MCGLAGVIFGKKRRRAEERDHLAWLFTRLLLLSDQPPSSVPVRELDFRLQALAV